jgi:hypothetical protein
MTTKAMLPRSRKCTISTQFATMTGSRKKNRSRPQRQRLPGHLRASKALHARDEARRIRNDNVFLKAELDDLIEQLSDWSRHLEGKEASICQCCSADNLRRCLCTVPAESLQAPSPQEPSFITEWRDSSGTSVSMMGASWESGHYYSKDVDGDIQSLSTDSNESSSGWDWSGVGLRRDGRM